MIHKERLQQTIDCLRLARCAHGHRLFYPTSRGVKASVLIDLISRHAPQIPIVTVDAGKPPAETLEVNAALERRYASGSNVYPWLLMKRL